MKLIDVMDPLLEYKLRSVRFVDVWDTLAADLLKYASVRGFARDFEDMNDMTEEDMEKANMFTSGMLRFGSLLGVMKREPFFKSVTILMGMRMSVLEISYLEMGIEVRGC